MVVFKALSYGEPFNITFELKLHIQNARPKMGGHEGCTVSEV